MVSHTHVVSVSAPVLVVNDEDVDMLYFIFGSCSVNLLLVNITETVGNRILNLSITCLHPAVGLLLY